MASELSQNPFPCYHPFLTILKRNTVGGLLALAAQTTLSMKPSAFSPAFLTFCLLLSLNSRILLPLQLLLRKNLHPVLLSCVLVILCPSHTSQNHTLITTHILQQLILHKHGVEWHVETSVPPLTWWVKGTKIKDWLRVPWWEHRVLDWCTEFFAHHVTLLKFTTRWSGLSICIKPGKGFRGFMKW